MASLLLVEDDKALNKVITNFLINNNFEVFNSYNGKDALDIFCINHIDLVISDIMMPIMDGYALLDEIRLLNKNMPFLFISAKNDLVSKQKGFDLGLDDYLEKPISNEELLMHIKALLRRAKINEKNKIIVGNFQIDKDEHQAYINDKEIDLTLREFNILYYMLSYPKKTFSRSKLMELFWDYDSSATSRTVDVYMAKLREKTCNCDSFTIQTVHGLGYKVIINE